MVDFLKNRLLRKPSDQLPTEPRDLTGYFFTRGGRAMRQPAMMPTLISMALVPVRDVGTKKGGERVGNHEKTERKPPVQVESALCAFLMTKAMRTRLATQALGPVNQFSSTRKWGHSLQKTNSENRTDSNLSPQRHVQIEDLGDRQ